MIAYGYDYFGGTTAYTYSYCYCDKTSSNSLYCDGNCYYTSAVSYIEPPQKPKKQLYYIFIFELIIDSLSIFFRYEATIKSQYNANRARAPPIMANGNIEMKISLEKVIHDELRVTLQNIFDEYGIGVQELTADWTDISSPEKTDAMVTKVSIRTFTIR